MGKNKKNLNSSFGQKNCKRKALASSMLERKVCFSMCYNWSGRLRGLDVGNGFVYFRKLHVHLILVILARKPVVVHTAQTV